MDEIDFEKLPSGYGELKNIVADCFDETVEIVVARDGNKTAKLAGRQVHSAYKPYEEAVKQMEKINLKEKKFVVIIGAGLGYNIEYLLGNIDPAVKIYVVEHSPVFLKYLLQNKIIVNAIIENRLFLYHTSNSRRFMYEIEKNFQLGIAPEYEIITNNICFEFSEKDYIVFLNILRDLISNNLVGTSTIFEFSKMWHKNSFRNMRHFAEAIGVNQLYKSFENMPVIVVAAGPSLDKNIRYLHWAQGKAVIIVVGTALKKVLSEGITPDFVMGIDGGEPNWEHFRRCEYQSYPFIFEPMVIPKILDNHTGPKIAFVSQNIVGSWGEHVLGEKGFVKMGGSVAISAYDFGVRIGGNPVVLLGQDLAFSGGKSHVSGSVYEKDTIKKDVNDIHQMEVEDIYGGKVITDRKLYTFLQYFERFIAMDHEENSSLRVIDATEGGAKINGTEVMSFKDVYYKNISGRTVNVRDKIEELQSKIDKSKNMGKLLHEKEGLKKKFIEIEKYADEGIKILKQAIQRNDYSRLSTLDELDKKIEKHPEVSHLIKFITQPIIAKIFRESKKVQGKELFELNLELYQGIKEGIKFNLHCLEEIDGSYLNHR